MKRPIITCLFLTIARFLFAQGSDAFQFRNNLQLELGGSGLLYSLNYERVLVPDGPVKMTAKVGVAYYPTGTNFIDWWLPISVNGLRTFGNHHFEFGIGQVITSDQLKKSGPNQLDDYDLIGTMNLGYRFQRPDGQFLFRVGFIPFFIIDYGRPADDGSRFGGGRSGGFFMVPFGGLAIGRVF